MLSSCLLKKKKNSICYQILIFKNIYIESGITFNIKLRKLLIVAMNDKYLH